MNYRAQSSSLVLRAPFHADVRLLFALLVAFSASTWAASFDCVRASNFAERTVCSERDLSEMDDLLAQTYKNLVTTSQNAEAVRSQQRTWLATRNKCTDVECLRRVYASRLAALGTPKPDIAPERPFVSSQVQRPAASRSAPPPSKNVAAKNLLTKHTARIAALGFSTKLLKSTLYLQTDLVNRPQEFISFEHWLALVFEHPELVRVTAIRSGKFEGVVVKLKAVQSQGFLFRFEDGELFPSHFVKDEEALPIETRDDAFLVAMAIMQIAEAGLPAGK